MYTKIKMDVSMKKLMLTIISLSFVYTLLLQASEQTEIVVDKKSELTIEMCKKHLGIDNYNFIKEVYNDENIVLLKCQEALMSK
jgi:hypothetical protein